MSFDDVKFAIYLAVSLVPSLVLHEYAHAVAADKLGDPTPRRWGRLTLNPKSLIDPFGSIILPGLSLLLVAAGPAANLVLAAVAGMLIRTGLGGEVGLLALAFLYVNVFMFVFQLMPVPGLDGAKLLARVLPPHPREVYVSLDQYLVLYMLVIFFLLAGPLLGIVRSLADVLFSLLAGT